MREQVTYEQDLRQILADYRNLEDGRPTHEGSDTFTEASVGASLAQDVRSRIDYVENQIHPDTADTEHLERHALLKAGLTRKPPSGASGAFKLTGTAGAVGAEGLGLTDELGQEFKTTEQAVIGQDGYVSVAAEAVSTGLSTRLAAGAVLTLTSPPVGFDGTAEVETAWQGGSDQEGNASLLARLLWYERHPPAGGNKYDYITWATAVPGVFQAIHYSLRRGLGTADTCILAAGGDRQPGQASIDAVQAIVDVNRPSGIKDARVYGPDLNAVGITGQVKLAQGEDLPTVLTRINTALDNRFAELLPGEGLTRAELISIINQVEGVVDVELTTPAANVPAEIDENSWPLLIKGQVDITEMAA